MLNLRRRGGDVRRFVADLEEWLIRTLAAFNVRGERREDRIGVWVRRRDKGEGCEDKIAAIEHQGEATGLTPAGVSLMRSPMLDGGDLVLAALPLSAGAPRRRSGPPGARTDVEGRERADQPFLKVGHEPAHVAAAPPEIKHRIGDALARPVIGELAAAAGGKHRKPRLHKVLGPGARPRRVERRMLDQPDQLTGLAGRNGGRRASMTASAFS